MRRLARIVPVILVAPSMAHAGVIVADSVADFSSIQGQNNWHYGYWAPGGAETYQRDQFQAFSVFNPDGRWIIELGEGGYYTEMHAQGQHPNGVVTTWGRTQVEHWAVRRWESNVDGVVDITGTIADIQLSDEWNGVQARIYVDGVQVWSQYVPQNATEQLGYYVQTEVALGSLVDFVVDPIDANDGSDGTIFTGQITLVPAPAGAAALIGGLGLLSGRRRR